MAGQRRKGQPTPPRRLPRRRTSESRFHQTASGKVRRRADDAPGKIVASYKLQVASVNGDLPGNLQLTTDNFSRSYFRPAAFAGADADAVVQGADEDLAVADLAG